MSLETATTIKWEFWSDWVARHMGLNDDWWLTCSAPFYMAQFYYNSVCILSTKHLEGYHSFNSEALFFHDVETTFLYTVIIQCSWYLVDSVTLMSIRSCWACGFEWWPIANMFSPLIIVCAFYKSNICRVIILLIVKHYFCMI